MTDAGEDKLLEMIDAAWKAQAIYVAAELGVADHLADGPRGAAALAVALDAHEPSLERLLRALVTLGLCIEAEDGAFALTPLGGKLTGDDPGSLRAWARWAGGHLWPLWGELRYSVMTGRSARQHLYGTRGFEHLERDPEAAAIFNQAMRELSRLHAAEIVRSYDFSPLRTIADIGGGHGELIAAIVREHGGVRGILFDQPQAIEGSRRHLEALGLTERVECIAGDFFESVPQGSDAYLLKSVIHDWDDEHALQILASCRAAIAPGARLLLVERVIPDRVGDHPTHQAAVRVDLTMLIGHGSGERREGEFRDLLRRAGFEVLRLVPAGIHFHVIEAAPA